MSRKIVVYGHGDERPNQGFPDEQEFQRFIKDEVFSKNRGRYHYSQTRDADVIVLSRRGWAHGHFDIEDREEPTREDKEEYDRVKCTYIVRASALYSKPVRLKDLGIKVGSYELPL